jgi:HSP20 family protein
MSNIIKKENARPATFGSVVDQLFHQNLDRWFNDEFWGFNGLQNRTGVPVNLLETGKTFELEIIAPGLQKQDFQLSFSGDTLTVSFEHKEENNAQPDDQRWVRREYRKQSFTRSFTIDDTVDVDKASAHYDNGILHLTLPKKEHAQRISRTINVQ